MKYRYLMRSSLLKCICTLIVIAALLPFELVKAQDTSPAGPVYIVQEGDTLWDIAYRFHVSQDALQNANGISNPNDISIGQKLVIPGLAGIEGILTAENIGYGESLQSLSLRFKLPVQTLKRLNHITSPGEIFAGYSLIIPQAGALPSLGKRTVMISGQSMLELAIQNGTDAWGIMASNDLKSSWEALPGDVLRVTGEDNNGPGALPGAIKSVTITGLIQGNTGEIQVNSEDDLSLSGELFNHPLNFFTDSDQLYSTLQGVYAMAVPGLYPLSLDTKLPDGSMHQFSQKVMIRKADFLFDRPLPVDPATLDPETNRSENELWFSATAQATPEKRWAGKLFLPVEPVFGECYSSRFGSRRSYNGSEYLFFHTGLDFCGQVGDPIYAAAPGVVVLATPLTVRGKATIIDHGWGVYTAYLHQSEILVNEGDQVEQGQLIGKVGNTGRVEGPHLHFEVIVGGIQVDPLEWLNKAFP